MMNKMVARVLTYELGLPSYGDSKLEKCQNFMKKDCIVIFKPAYGFFRMLLRMVPFSAATNDE